jgi:broad specificity phosphatase PhoE
MLTPDDHIRILLVRHGESEGNANPLLYVQKGDSNVGLTEKGWLQAFRNGQFLGKHYRETGTKKWPSVRISSYLRPKQTFSGMLAGMEGTFDHEPRLREDPRLIEKFFGAASLLEFPHKDADLVTIATLKLLTEHTYKGDPFAAKNFLGESTKETVITIKNYMDGTLARDIESGENDFLFVAHGAVIQAFIMNWAHVQMRDKNKIGNPGNCDIIEISGTRKNWKITRIYDGEKFEPANRNIMENIKPFSYADLPPVPDFIKGLKP